MRGMSSAEKRAALDEARASVEELPYSEIRERIRSGNADWRFPKRGQSGKEYDVLVQASWWDESRGCIIVIVQIGWAIVSSFVRCPEGVVERHPPTSPRNILRTIFRPNRREDTH
jgi:hypothetical protein